MIVNPWTEEEIEQLRKNYLDKSIEELSKIIGRSEFGITSKLQTLVEEDILKWDKNRINYLNSTLHRKYRVNRELYRIKDYTDEEITILRKYYLDKTPKELAEMLGRGKYGIVVKLEKLVKKAPKKWNKKRIRFFRRQISREYFWTVHPEKKRIWTEDEMSKLKRNYLDKSLEELVEITARGKYGIVMKLKELSKKESGWKKKRIRALYSKLYREYAVSHSEQIKKVTEKRKKKLANDNRIYLKFLQKEKDWSERDIAILSNIYFTHNFIKLTNIFCLKDAGVHKKLRELYEQDNFSWDIERIVELENEAKKYSLEEIKEKAIHHKFFRVHKKLKRRLEIDNLIKQGFNMHVIGLKLGISHRVVYSYVYSRGLFDWYKSMQKII